jgi:uncharacterized sporulation protein YeaH/YhbH (DUF444 family)
MSKINSDVDRFKRLVRGKIRENLKDFIGREKMITQNGAGKKISIPLDYINTPHFTFGQKQKGGVGQDDGSGEPGDSVNGNGNKKGKNGKQGGKDGEGDGSLGVEFDPSELVQILREALELPRLEDKGKGDFQKEKLKYNKISNIGNESLRHNKRTFQQSLLRSLSENRYNALDPGRSITIEKCDKRYKTSSTIEKPDINSVLIFQKDCSGSMSETHNHLVQASAFWIDLMLRDTYGDKLQTIWMVFDTEAKIVPKNEFFRISSGGGTRVSSSLALAYDLIEKKYPYSNTNTFIFNFSDGGNYDADNNRCVELLNEKILPNCNQFAYGQVQETDNLLATLQSNFDNHEKVSLAHIPDEAGVMGAIKSFFTPKK